MYPETIGNIHLSQSLFVNIYLWLLCRLKIWVSNWLLCYDFTSPRSCVNQFRVSTYLDGHMTVSQNLIFQIKILQVSDKFQKTYSYLNNWLTRYFLWKLLLQIAISDVHRDVPYLPPDLPRSLTQVSQSKSRICHYVTPKMRAPMKICLAEVFFVSSGTWPRNLPMLAGYLSSNLKLYNHYS